MKKKFRDTEDSIEKLDHDFLTDVVSQLNIFKGCDFRSATFLDKYEKEMLGKMVQFVILQNRLPQELKLGLKINNAANQI